jgi:UPF0716 protein FxsA
MVKWFILAILLLPVVEIAVFILVAALIGVGWALGLMLLTTLAGFLVLRRTGRAGLARLRVVDGKVDSVEADGLLNALGGLLLLLPGFVTDLIGAVLLLGPVRRWCGAVLLRTVRVRAGRRDAFDLTPGEWQRVPDRELEDKRRPADPDRP